MAHEVNLYRWPLGERSRYVTKKAMFLKISLAALALILVFAVGFLWISLNEPRTGGNAPVSLEVDKLPNLVFIRRCCLKDVRSAQEALTSLSVEAQKVRMRLDMAADAKKDHQAQKMLSALTLMVDQSKYLWDQLQAFVEDSHQDKRRQLRDIRINTDGLTEHFYASESCCGAHSRLLHPLMKEYMQIAAYRVGVIRHTIENNTELTPSASDRAN
jgi:hypothetical protein